MMTSISAQEYKLLKDLVYQRFGINLGDKKQTLVVGRLQHLLREKGFASFKEYYDYVLNDQSREGLDSLINRISTNHTYFNRENAHFNFFINAVLPEAEQKISSVSDPTVRIWSAGCSSGEEPYTLAMLMLNYLEKNKRKWKPAILATDISERALSLGRTGIYEENNILKLPARLRNKYLKKIQNGQYEVTPKLKQYVLFRRLNLMRPDFPFKRKFHTIFCRNVMIYFDQETKEQLASRFAAYLEPGGYLIIGLSESLGRSHENFRYIQPAVYQRI